MLFWIRKCRTGGSTMCQLFAGQPRENYRSQTRSLRLNGQSTSIRLETVFWDIIDKIAKSENLSTPRFISKLHSEVLNLHGDATNFTSQLRCTCMIYVQQSNTRQAPLTDAWRATDDSETHRAAAL